MRLTDEQLEKMSIKERVAMVRRQQEKDLPPKLVKSIREGSRAAAKKMLEVAGYCKLCGGAIDYFDKAAGTGDLCLDCYSEQHAREWEEEQRKKQSD